MNNGKNFWLKNNRALLNGSMIISFIVVFVIAVIFAKANSNRWFLAFLLVIAVGALVVIAAHSLWGLLIEMADNIAFIANDRVETYDSEVKIPRLISERTKSLPSRFGDSSSPLFENVEYDDGTWECGHCKQFNDPDCGFCTNCGRPKGSKKRPTR